MEYYIAMRMFESQLQVKMDEFHELIFEQKKVQYKKVNTTWLYLPEIQKQVKLIYDVENYLAEGWE